MAKKRARIHPAVAVAAIAAVTILAVVAEILNPGSGETWKVAAAGIIAAIAGIKLRSILPVT